MNAVSPLAHDESYDDDAPATQRAPESSIARLIARTRDDDTLSRSPSIDLIALTAGAEGNAIARMRALYASGDAEHALAVAETIAGATHEHRIGGLILVSDDELAAITADIEEIDSAFLEHDPSP